MDYAKLVEVYENLENSPSKHKKRDILSEIFKETDETALEKIVILATGKVFPAVSSEELGIAQNMIKRALSKATGYSETVITEEFKKTGDLGLVAEKLVKTKTQSTLMKKKLTLEKVFDNLQELSSVSGTGSQERKLNILAELIISSKPKEAKYIVRTALGALRVGVAEGIVRDAIAKAFDVDPRNVERAWNMVPDYRKIARIAKRGGDEELKKIKIEIGTSVQVLLAEKSPSLDAAIIKFQNPMLEVKYDGARVQIHKDGNDIKIFTRRLEDVTNQFPDIVRYVKNSVKPNVKRCILDGEMVAIDKKTKRPAPFQELSQRIQRKHNIEKMMHEIPIQVHLFDVLFLDGKPLLKLPLKKRREILEKILTPIKDEILLSKKLVTNDIEGARRFYEDALKAGYEGVMVKNMDSEYQPGRRVGYWLKVKPIMESLDLVIIGAEWGTGKRANWLSSFTLACRDEKTGKFLPCGMMGTGLTDEEFKEMTEKLKPLIEEEKGRTVTITPKMIFEIGYEEIQKSPKYSSGFALRFPRLIRDRTSDKSVEDVDELKRLKKLYYSQKRSNLK